MNGFYQMVVDPASHHVFIDGQPYYGNDTIIVLSADGTVTGSITGESGAGGMVLDGSTLYVARCGWGVIDEIDTVTVTKIGSISAQVGGACHLGLAGGRLWYATTDQWTPIDSVTIAAPHTVTPDVITGMFDPAFHTAPNDPDELWAVDTDISASTVKLIDASQPQATVVSSRTLPNVENFFDWTFTADGQIMYVASGGLSGPVAYHTSDLSLAGTYPTGAYPNSVDLDPSESNLVGGADENALNVQEFAVGDAVPELSLNTADNNTDFTAQDGVRFSEDGSRIFSVTTGVSGSPVELHVTPALPQSALTIRSNVATASPGADVHLSGQLHLGGGADPTGQSVTVTAAPPGGSPQALGTATADAGGNWSIDADGLAPGGVWTFRASFDGAGTYASSAASTTVRVGNPEPSLTVSARASTVSYGGSDVITVHLGKWHSSRTVTLYRSMDGSAPVKVAGGTVSSAGTKSFTVHPSRRTVYTARWAGDDTYLPKASTGKVVLVRAGLSVTQAGYYRVSGAVRLYHYRSGCWTNNSLCPHLSGHLAPGISGLPVRFTLQRLVNGRWETALAGTSYTSSGLSGVVYRYTGTGYIGHLMRVHATWAGNSDYLAATSPWIELELTK